MSCIERADAADPSYIYIYVHERGCNQPPSNFLLPPPEFIEIVISESDWIFLDDLGRIERDQCLGIRGSLSRSSVRNLALPPINERNRESPPLLERVIQIDDQISFFFFPLLFRVLSFSARQIPSRAPLGNVFFQRVFDRPRVHAVIYFNLSVDSRWIDSGNKMNASTCLEYRVGGRMMDRRVTDASSLCFFYARCSYVRW